MTARTGMDPRVHVAAAAEDVVVCCEEDHTVRHVDVVILCFRFSYSSKSCAR